MTVIFILGSLLGVAALVVIVAVVILGIIICLCACRRKQKAKETSKTVLYTVQVVYGCNGWNSSLGVKYCGTVCIIIVCQLYIEFKILLHFE